jgi:hypothetical protein
LDPNGAANDVIIVANNERVIVGEQLADNPRALGKRKRPTAVTTLQTCIRVVEWMINDDETNGEKGLHTQIVKAFPEHFRAFPEHFRAFPEHFRAFPEHFRGMTFATIMKSSRWWEKRATILQIHDDHDNMVSCNSAQPGKAKKVLTKAAPGRGPKRAPWVDWLYPLIVDEFDRYRKMGVKFSPKLLVCLAKDILVEMNHPDFPPNLQHKGTTIIDRIDIKWIQRFQTVNNIVGRAQTGKLMLSPTHQQHIDKQIAFHLGQLAREFRAGTLDENLVENINETHCKVNLDNSKTQGFRGDNDVKYADVVSGGMGMTLMIQLTGRPHVRICNPCVIFQNAIESYPILGVPNDVPGVCYRMTKKGFIT